MLGWLVMMLAWQSESKALGDKPKGPNEQLQGGEDDHGHDHTLTDADIRLFRFYDLPFMNGDKKWSNEELKEYEIERREEMDVFRHYDANGDGVFDWEEASIYTWHSMIEEIFKHVDTDQSGDIDFMEHFVAFKAAKMKRGGGAGGPIKVEIEEGSGEKRHSDKTRIS